MKSTIIIGTVILSLTTFAQNTNWQDNFIPPNPNGTVSGRFQLLAGTVSTDEVKSQPIIMRIDTATGKVWIYNQMSYPVPRSGGQHILTAGWIETPENLGKSIEQSKQMAAFLSTNAP